MPYESRLALGLVPYTAGEQPKDRKFIKLNTNENPYPPSPEVEKALSALRIFRNTHELIWTRCVHGKKRMMPFGWQSTEKKILSLTIRIQP